MAKAFRPKKATAFRAHAGTRSSAEFAAHTSVNRAQVFAAHTKALTVTKPKAVKAKKPKKPVKMSMTKYKAALTKQITAALEAKQGL